MNPSLSNCANSPFPTRFFNQYAVPLILGAMLLLTWSPAAQAHAPHDVIHIVRVSPDFATDQTIHAFINLTDHAMLARSSDGGRSWLEYGAPVLAKGVIDLAISPDYAIDGTLFAATSYGGIWRSKDFGLTWHEVNTGITSLYTNSVAISTGYAVDRTVLACTGNGLFRSTDGGDTWSQVTNGILESYITAACFAPGKPGTVYAGGKIIHRSDDGGATWTALHSFTHVMKTIAISPGFISNNALAVCFGRYGDGVQGSITGGANWIPFIKGLSDQFVNHITIADDETMFAVTKTDGCFRANHLFGAWVKISEGFEKLSNQTDDHYRSVAASPIFSQDGKVFVGAFEGFFRSTNRGDTWRQSDVYHQRICRRVVPSPDYAQDRLLYVGNYGGGPFVLDESGPIPRWSALAGPITSLWTSVLSLSPSFAYDQTLFYAYMGLWRSTDGGSSWIKLSLQPLIPRAITFSPEFIFDRIVYLGSGGEGSYASVDAGDNWIEMTGGLPPDVHTTDIRTPPLFPLDPMIFLSTKEAGVWRSPDAGVTWFPINNGLLSTNVRTLDISPDFVSDGLLVAGTVGKGLFRSDDRGDTWVPINNDFPSGSDNIIESVAISPDFAIDRTLFVTSLFDGVFKSTDGGWTWNPAQSGLPLDAPRRIAFSPDYAQDSTVFLSTHAWLWRSQDGGASWNMLPGYNRVDDRHPSIYKQGDWSIKAQAGAFAQVVTLSDTGRDTLELEFRGDSISWYATRDAESGIADILLDGSLILRVDLYSPFTKDQQCIYSNCFGSPDWHTIRIRVTGRNNHSSLGAFVKSDGFEYTF